MIISCMQELPAIPVGERKSSKGIKGMEKKSREEVQFVLDRIDAAWGIWGCALDQEFRIWAQSANHKIPEDAAVLKRERVALIYEALRGHREPQLFSEGGNIHYAGFFGAEDEWFILGPFSMGVVSREELYSFRRRRGIKDTQYTIPSFTFADFLNCMVLCCYLLTGRQTTEELLIQDNQSISMLQKREEVMYESTRQMRGDYRLSYQQEQQFLARVEKGIFDREQFRLTRENLNKMNAIGTLAENDNRKQMEYMVITTIALSCRAAIRGGMNVNDAYSLADLYYQRVAKAGNVMDMLEIYVDMMENYSAHVRAAREARISYDVEKCKDYIARNRMKRITLTELAEAVGKNPSYLSAKFSRQVGMTIQEYIRTQRLEAAANMLAYSDTSIGDIADYLHFSSQSYFGACFQKQFHETPARYREHHRVVDFFEDGGVRQ